MNSFARSIWSPRERAPSLTLPDAPGATTCNLGITRSLTLADVLAKELADQSDPEIQKLRIKISGCPNSCGQHHIADIGFYGNARKIGNQQAPFYQMLLGGEVSERGVRFGKQIIPLAAKQVPNVVREVIGFYRNDRHADETFRQWVERTPPAEITDRLKQYAEVAEHDPRPSLIGVITRYLFVEAGARRVRQLAGRWLC